MENDSRTKIAVSCPVCGKETVVLMETASLPCDIENFLSAMSPGVKRYSFDGDVKCCCGSLVFVTLTVSGGNME